MEKKLKSKNTREELIRQGVRLLREHGYHGTGIQKIVNAVNVPKGSFYNFFPLISSGLLSPEKASETNLWKMLKSLSASHLTNERTVKSSG